MTDNFLQKLEEKVMILLTELEDLRFTVQQLKEEKANLEIEKFNYTQKLQGLITLLDSVDDATEESVVPSQNTYELEAMQGPEEYATA